MFNPQILLSNSILKSISQIEAARAVIENAPLLPLYERKFKSDATLRRVHFSTAIEGNYLEMSEVKKIIGPDGTSSPVNSVDGSIKLENDSGGEVVSRKRDIYEVINYRDVVAYMEKLSKTDFKLSEEVIKEIHKILLKNIMDQSAGKYRKDVATTVNFATGEKLYLYESHENIPRRMADLIEWANSDTAKEIHPVIKAAILHLELVQIHPFEEGNGRLARAIATLSLSVDGYEINHFFCLDEYYDSNSQDYYHHLGEGFKNSVIWIEYFALGMAIELARVKERVTKISMDAKIKERTGQMFITERQEKIIDWINTYGHFRNQDFSTLFPDLSDDTVLRELKGLIDGRIIAKRGMTKSARYELV